eukprot:920037-Prymnesium_polylepis.2
MVRLSVAVVVSGPHSIPRIALHKVHAVAGESAAESWPAGHRWQSLALIPPRLSLYVPAAVCGCTRHNQAMGIGTQKFEGCSSRQTPDVLLVLPSGQKYPRKHCPEHSESIWPSVAP